MKKTILFMLCLLGTARAQFGSQTSVVISDSAAVIAQIARDSTYWIRSGSVVSLANAGDSVFVGKTGIGISPTVRMLDILSPDNVAGFYAETLENGGSSNPFSFHASVATFNSFLLTLELNSAVNGSFIRYLRSPSTSVYLLNSAGVHSTLAIAAVPTPASNLASFYGYDPGSGTTEFGAGREGEARFYPVTVAIADAFTTTATTDTVSFTGATTASIWTFCGYTSATASTDIVVRVEAIADGVVIHRSAGTTSGATYAVKLEKL